MCQAPRATLRKPPDAAAGLVDDRPRSREILLPRRRHLDPGLSEHSRDVRQVVRLAVHGDLQELSPSEWVAEPAAPAVACLEPVDEVCRVVRIARAIDELVERLDEAGGEMFPDEDRA